MSSTAHLRSKSSRSNFSRSITTFILKTLSGFAPTEQRIENNTKSGNHDSKLAFKTPFRCQKDRPEDFRQLTGLPACPRLKSATGQRQTKKNSASYAAIPAPSPTPTPPNPCAPQAPMIPMPLHGHPSYCHALCSMSKQNNPSILKRSLAKLISKQRRN